MLTQIGNIWEARQPKDYICITTNGVVKSNGRLVMGKGIALEAAQKYPLLPEFLGSCVRRSGLRVEVEHVNRLIAFPTKYHFKYKSDINLILKSTLQLLDVAQRIEGRVLLPRPGCQNGKLDWLEVEPMLQHYLKDNRFIVFSKSV